MAPTIRRLRTVKLFVLAIESTTLKGRATERTGMQELEALVTYLQRIPQPVAAPEAPRLHTER